MGICFNFNGSTLTTLYSCDGDAVTRYITNDGYKGKGVYTVPNSFCDALLKIWQKLVQMRVTDLQKDRAPPDIKPLVEPMFGSEPEEKTEEEVFDSVVEPPPPELVATKKRKSSSTVPVKLSEEAVIKGVTVAAGEIVKVSRKEADGLVEAGKGTIAID